MASLINIALGMSFNKGVMNAVIGDFNKIQTSSKDATKAVKGLGDGLTKIGHIQSLAAATNIINSALGSLKGFKDEFSQKFKVLSDYAVAGDKIAKTSRLVGLSVHDYQAFSSAAQHSGMSVEEMDNAFKRFNVTLGKARSGDKASAKIFDSILPEGKKLSDYNDTTSLISGIADSYTKLGSAEQKAFVTQELFGRGGQKISELFKDGGESLKKYIDGYDAAFSKDGAEKAEQFNDSFQDMNESINVIKTSLYQDLFGAFKEVFDSVRSFLKSSDGDEFRNNLKAAGQEVSGFVKKILPLIPKILNGIVSAVNFLGSRITVIGGIVLSFIPILTSIGIGLSAITGIAASTLVPVLGLIISAVMLWGGVIMDIYSNWDMLKSFIVDDVWGAIKQFFSDCIDAVNDWVNMFVEDAKWLWNGFKSIFIDPFVVFFTSLPDMMSDLWQGFKDGVSQIGSFIYNTFFGSIASAINGAKDLLKSLPLVGGLFADIGTGANVGAQSQIATAVQQSYSTTTNRFAVDFQNMPQGVRVTPPDHGDFDWSRSYTLAGAV